MCCRTLCYRPTYAIAYASPPPPWPKSRANTAPLYTVSRANLILPGTSKASTAPLLIVHKDLTNTGGCDHVVPVKDNQTVSTQAKLHNYTYTCMHSTCTILRYISTCASDCTVTSGPTCGDLHASVCFAPLYLPCICITITTSAHVRTFFTR